MVLHVNTNCAKNGSECTSELDTRIVIKADTSVV